MRKMKGVKDAFGAPTRREHALLLGGLAIAGAAGAARRHAGERA